MYALLVAIGVVAATLVARSLPRDDGIPETLAVKVRLAALVGGVLGAYLFELPADVFGWAPPTPDGIARLGGRTVLGGLLGGWLAVELAKKRLGILISTGDRFAAPLAVALTFGRVGCVLAGCCPGIPIAHDSPLAKLSVVLHGAPRFPASYLEAVFHGLAGALLIALARQGLLARRRFALYIGSYAILRFSLEFVRDVPRPFFGLSYYQLLALGLSGLALHSLRLRPTRAEFAREPLAP